tara:strand:+ start:7 stop:393 length:387 start_codon:yes stop_codon:yes gene_type:complete
MDFVAAATVLGPPIMKFVSGLFGDRSQSQQAEKAREIQQRQWKSMFAHVEKQMAIEERQWEAMEQQREAQWMNTVDLQSPYSAASRAMLASTMQMNVPKYEPLYSTAEGVQRRRNPYGDYVNPGPRSA